VDSATKDLLTRNYEIFNLEFDVHKFTAKLPHTVFTEMCKRAFNSRILYKKRQELF